MPHFSKEELHKMKLSMREIAVKHFGTNTHVDNVIRISTPIVPVARVKHEKGSKLMSTLIAEKNTTDVNTSTEVVAEVTADSTKVNPQVITKPENLIELPEPITGKKPLCAGQKALAKSLLKTIDKKSVGGTGWTRPPSYCPETGSKWRSIALMSLVDSGKIVEKESGIFWVD